MLEKGNTTSDVPRLMLIVHRLYYTDCSLIGALKDQMKQCWIHLSYNLVCQYLPNLLTQITKKQFPNLTNDELIQIVRIKGNIGQLHIVVHILHCLALYYFNHMLDVARSCGNVLESVWDKTKQAGGSLKQMNHGLHHDMLDFLLNDWNWSKVVHLSQSFTQRIWMYTTKFHCAAKHLERKYIDAVSQQEKLQISFAALTATHPPELVKQ